MPKHNRGIRKSVKGRLHMAAPHVEEFKSWLRERRIPERRPSKSWCGCSPIGRTGPTPRLHGRHGPRPPSTHPGQLFKEGRTGQANTSMPAAFFIRHLQDRGVVPRFAKADAGKSKVRPILNAFRTWMRSHRGIAESSLDTYQTTLVGLLADARRRSRVLYGSRPYGRSFLNAPGSIAWRAQSRSPLRLARFCAFLVATGRCPPGREFAVPGFAGWRLTSVPGFLGPAEIERILAACAGESRLRDRAVILLLARLGLRASEVANLDLRHVDWGNGRLSVAGKSRRAEWLPLTQEIGDAIIAYIERGRPRVGTHPVVHHGPAADPARYSGAVKGIVRRALTRAGVKSAHQGAHILRHSAATTDAPPRRQPCRRRRGTPASRSDDDDALRQGGLRAPLRDCPTLGGEAGMLIDDIERYLALRRSLGFKLERQRNIWVSFAPLCRGPGANITSARKPPSSGRGRRRRRERDTTGSAGLSRVRHGSCMRRRRPCRFCRQASFVRSRNKLHPLHLSRRRNCVRLLDAAGRSSDRQPIAMPSDAGASMRCCLG